MVDYPWYEVVGPEDGLQQGDILERLVVLTPEPTTDNPGAVVEVESNLIIMTQSCDLENAKLTHLVMCPVWLPSELGESDPRFLKGDFQDLLVKGRVEGFHPINKSDVDGLQRGWRVVQFQRVIEMRVDKVREQLPDLGKRLRLASPYKEHLSQGFARFFMRVGLPVAIERD